MQLHLAICFAVLQAALTQEFFFRQPSYTITEGEGNLVAEIERTSPWNQPATVDVTIEGDRPDGDVQQISDNVYITTFEFAINVNVFRITIQSANDNIPSPGFSAVFTLSNPSSGSIGSPSSSILTILDDDEFPPPEWNQWGPYSSCTAVCGGGTQIRSRTCYDPNPADALTCTPGLSQDSASCNTQPCVAEWNPWGAYSVCSAACDGGTQIRTRTCNDQDPMDNVDCTGPSQETQTCNTEICEIAVCTAETRETPYGPVTTPENQPVDTLYTSSEVCPWYTRFENLPVARVLCVQGNSIAHWEWDIDCGEEKTMQEILAILANQPITIENAESTLEMTNSVLHPDEIEVEDISNTADILNKVATLQLPDRKVTDLFVDVIDTLMNVDQSVLMAAQRLDGSSSNTVESFEEQLQVVETHREGVGDWPYRKVTSNVAIEVFQASYGDLNQGIYAASNTNTLLTLERGSSSDLDAKIEIPPVISAHYPTGARVAIDVLANNRLLTSVRLQDQNSRRTDFRTITNSRVISATVGDQKINGLDSPVRMTYRPIEPSANNTQCVFWDFPRNDWVTDGCQYVGQSDSRIICECNHLTNFAILMDIYGGSTLTKTQDFILEILSYVGCGLSIIGLVVTLLTYCTSRKLKSKRPNQILISLSSALLGLYVVFVILLSIDTGRDQTELEVVACSVLAGVLHYFTLASIFWMAVESYNMYLMFIKVINSYVPDLLLKTSIFAWGGPLIIVAITGGVARDGYARSDFCFLEKWPLVGGVLVPIGLILLFNITIFVFVMMKLSRESPASKLQQKRKGLKMRRLRNAICIMTLMGLTWAIGYLSIIKAASFFSQLIFCLLNAMQGYAIFMLYCVQQADVRNTWRRLCGTIRVRPEPSVSKSRGTGNYRQEFISSNRRSDLSSADHTTLLNRSA